MARSVASMHAVIAEVGRLPGAPTPVVNLPQPLQAGFKASGFAYAPARRWVERQVVLSKRYAAGELRIGIAAEAAAKRGARQLPRAAPNKYKEVVASLRRFFAAAGTYGRALQLDGRTNARLAEASLAMARDPVPAASDRSRLVSNLSSSETAIVASGRVAETAFTEFRAAGLDVVKHACKLTGQATKNLNCLMAATAPATP